MGTQLFKFGISKNKPAPGKSRSFMENDLGKLEMSDQTFQEMRDVIYKLCGIYYTESKKYLLEGRIAKRLVANKMKTYEEYISFIKSFGGRDELKDLFEAITINETYFFRAPQQFDAFENILVPEIIKNKPAHQKNVFRIWSAASSTGEEAYTTAIIILERLQRKFPNVQFQILGSDINNAVLESARKGIYKEYAIRNIPEDMLRRYFTQQGNTYVIKDHVKKMVKFMNVNLYDANQMRAISSCDVIFCANVLIYFDIPSKQQVVSHLYNSLNKGGYLFIGYSESLHGISKAFKLVHLPKAMAYLKE
jgi:chemotaxis protein methyltransferase CheR